MIVWGRICDVEQVPGSFWGRICDVEQVPGAVDVAVAGPVTWQGPGTQRESKGIRKLGLIRKLAEKTYFENLVLLLRKLGGADSKTWCLLIRKLAAASKTWVLLIRKLGSC